MAPLLKAFLIGVLVAAGMPGYAQASGDYLLSFIDTASGRSLVGFKDRAGRIVIPAKYLDIGYDASAPEKMYRTACVYGDSGWVFINRKDSVVLVPFIFDNGPDYIEEGLFRFVEQGRMGFANKRLQKIIPAKYSFVTPFKEGIAAYYIGGERIYEGGVMGDGHWYWGGHVTGQGYINHQGQEFDSVGPLKHTTREAWTKNKEQVLLNSRGQVIKRLGPVNAEPQDIRQRFQGTWMYHRKYYSSTLQIWFEPGKDYALVKDIGTGEGVPHILQAHIVGNKLIIYPQEHESDYCEMEVQGNRLLFRTQPTVWEEDGTAVPPRKDGLIQTIFQRQKGKAGR